MKNHFFLFLILASIMSFSSCDKNESSKPGKASGSLSFELDGVEHSFNLERITVPNYYDCEDEENSACGISVHFSSGNLTALIILTKFETGTYNCPDSNSEPMPFFISIEELMPGESIPQAVFRSDHTDCGVNITKVDDLKLNDRDPNTGKFNEYARVKEFTLSFNASDGIREKEITNGFVTFSLK